ncbi:hypothetical protein FS837_004269 [Tulasnella sp. UAMH 9824]|nr:hypothetical protein FS837_004269 [Tulasnella sp. UAMH 9824]
MEENSSDIIALLLRPSLRSIKFLVNSDTAESFLIRILRAVNENKTLSIQEMDFHFVWDVGPSLGDIADAIASQTNLRRLTFSGQSDIAYLAGDAKDLPFLEEFEVSGISADVPEIDYHDMYLRSLTTFTAVGRPPLIHCLLRAVGSNRLAKLALNFSHSGSTDMSPEPFTELQRFRPQLAHLELALWETFAWADLVPVLNLTELQTFQLAYSSTDDSAEITDDRLKQMVDAWPNLTQLVKRH